MLGCRGLKAALGGRARLTRFVCKDFSPPFPVSHGKNGFIPATGRAPSAWEFHLLLSGIKGRVRRPSCASAFNSKQALCQSGLFGVTRSGFLQSGSTCYMPGCVREVISGWRGYS